PAIVFPEPCPYDVTQDLPTQLFLAYDAMKRVKEKGKRVESLAYTYYFGARLHLMTPTEKSTIQGKYTSYFIRATTRLYYLFEPFGVEQLHRTTHTKLSMIANLKKEEFQCLCQYEPVEHAFFGEE
ncbi:7844_t:CDS:1, partial [Cetraspora pellucida]